MSGSKSGEIAIDLGASPVTVMCVAVDAYIATRDRIRKEREEAMLEQKKGIAESLDAWRRKLSASAADVSSSPVRTSGDIISGMVSSVPGSSSVKAVDFLNEMSGGTATPSSFVPPREADSSKRHDVIDNIEKLLRGISVPLSKDVFVKVKTLQSEQDISRVAAIARDIRIEVNHEIEGIKQGQQEAKKILDALPPDFPTDARKLLSEVADGRERLDDKLREIIHEALKQTEANRRQAAANILSGTLSEMGYEVSPVSNSIFTEGGDVYFRNSDWDDGYCIKLGVNDCRINFNMMKTVEGDSEKDASMEEEWKSEFENVKKRLGEKGISITNIKVNSEPGDTPVPINKKIPIKTEKKKRKPTVAYRRTTYE